MCLNCNGIFFPPLVSLVVILVGTSFSFVKDLPHSCVITLCTGIVEAIKKDG